MKKKFSIGDASKMCRVPIKTLRYYDSIGLLVPQFRNEENNYRYYSQEQLTTLLVIRRMRAQGFSIKNIQDVLSHPDLSYFEMKMAERCREIDEEIALLGAKKDSCLTLLGSIQEGVSIVDAHPGITGTMENEIHLENIPRDTMYFTREIMKRYANADVSLRRWTDIYEKCTELGLKMKSPIIVTFYTQPLDQFLMKDCDVEFGVCIDPPPSHIADHSNIRTYGGFRAAVTYHIGSYRDIMKSHIALIQWINQNDYSLTGPACEKFILSPLDVNDESQYLTKVIMPVKKI